ncbi:MAG: 3-oxoacyl-ACP synthase [Bacteroidota bacterium]
MVNKSLKSLLYDKCLEYAEQRILNAQTAMNLVTESGNDETKSSAGDKHETGRAMAQLEQEKATKQLREALELRDQLLKIGPFKQSSSISNGSLVLTDQDNFYISIAAGKIQVDTTVCFAISSSAPIALAFMGSKPNQVVNFKGRNYRINDII